MSMSESAAMMTTAASAVCGRSASRRRAPAGAEATRPAPTRPVTWLLAPDCSATAVREPLAEIAKPWKRPAATLAAPTPIISWFGVDLVAAPGGEARRRWRWCRSARRARCRRRRRASVADVAALVHGNGRHGEALGQRADRLHALGREVEHGGDDGGADHRDEHRRDLRREIRGSTEQERQDARPTTQRRACWSGRGPVKNAWTSSMKPSASVEKPNSLGSWPTMMVMARPFM